MAANNIVNNTMPVGFTASGGNINISTDAVAQTVNVGTGAANKTVTVGSTNGASSLTLQMGSGGMSYAFGNTINNGTYSINLSNDAATSTVNIGTGAAVKTVTLGSTNTTSGTTINAGSGGITMTNTNVAYTINTGTNAINVSNDSGAASINLATGAAVKTVTLGSTNTTSITTLAGGTGGVQITNTFLNLPTTSSTAGQLRINNDWYIQAKQTAGFGADFWMGRNAGNFTGSSAFGGNTGLGYQALDAIASSTGTWASTGAGVNACGAVTTGLRNTGIGYGALTGVTTGAANTAVGYLAGSSWGTTDHDNVAIANTGTAGDTNVCRIGAGTGTGEHQLNLSFISGIRGITTVNNNAIAVLVDSAGQLGTVSSSIKKKENIVDLPALSHIIMQLRPVTFDMIGKPDYRKCVGLIAEEVDQVANHFVVYNEKNEPETVKYHELSILLLNELKRLLYRIEELEKSIA